MRANFLCVAVALTSCLLAAPAGADETKDKAATRSVVAVFSLKGPIVETPAGDDFPFGSAGAVSLRDLVERLQQARNDQHVKAVAVLLGSTSFSLAQVEEIRRVIDDLRAAGKDGLTVQHRRSGSSPGG